MQKVAFTSIAAAVGLALASGAAHAQLASPTPLPSTAPTSDTTLMMAVWNTNNEASEIVNLGYTFDEINNATGNLTPNSATSPFVTATATNPAGVTESVLQLNFGTIANIGTSLDFNSTEGAQFAIYSVAAPADLGPGIQGQVLTTSTGTPTSTTAGDNTFVQNVQSEIAAWDQDDPNEGTALDVNCSTTECVQSGPLAGGGVAGNPSGLGTMGTSIGSSLNFYDLTGTSRGVYTESEYANALGAGFFSLSSTGELTWNVPEAVSAVPLPAAAWLFASGLLGLGLIGRRRGGASA